ncbi:YfgM family protein [Thalassotalea crassostreae]|uniref:YfgM family protein n=1 Tax=Thalassotalea crassostreae TaxID=1763536 RepID=UPI0008399AD4|nr:tetratricopeptide repeat protein [Thalassotalea crassostreae]
MEAYQTEEQQVEAIKKYWKDNGNSIIAGLVIGLGGFVGWNLYQESQVEAQYVAAAEYQQTIENYANETEGFRENTEQFIAANQGTAYSSLAAMALAKDAVSHQDWVGAEKHLTTAITNAESADLKAIATLRLARVQVQQQAYEKALATLANPLPESYLADVEEIKGDTYLLQGNKELARTAYQAAANAGGLETNPTLQTKIDDLAVVVAG